MPIELKISKPTKNVLTATSLDDFYLHSSYPLLQVHSSGTISTSILGTQTIMHNLGYKPFVLVFTQFVDTDGFGGPIISSEFYQHDWYIEGASVTFYGLTKVYTDKIEIMVGNSDDGARPGVVQGFYYIFKNPIT